jgi:hypothetical protein
VKWLGLQRAVYKYVLASLLPSSTIIMAATIRSNRGVKKRTKRIRRKADGRKETIEKGSPTKVAL